MKNPIVVSSLLVFVSLASSSGASAEDGGPTVNIAPYGLARQSSTYESHHAGRAIDGNTNGHLHNFSVAHNLGGWLELDLLRPRAIDRVVIHNRTDAPQWTARIVGISVELSATPCDAPTLIGTAESIASAVFVHTRVFAERPKARYVCLRENEHMNLAEVEVFVPVEDAPEAATGPDLARGGEALNWARAAIARLSTTAAGGDAVKAIDGATLGMWNQLAKTAAVATPGANQWLELSLGTSAPIDVVVVHNRMDVVDQLSGAIVQLADKACDAPGFVALATSPPYAGNAPSQRFYFGGRTARYVCLRQARNATLGVAEIEAWSPRPAGQAPNLARGKPARQSSIATASNTAGLPAGYESRPHWLTDGFTNGRFDRGGIAHTKKLTGLAAVSQVRQWLEVDLGASEPLGSVVIHNRIDCCSERLDGAVIEVRETPCDQPAPSGVALPPTDASPTLEIALAPGTKGRYVCLRHTRNEYLHIAELQVFPPMTDAAGVKRYDRYPAVSRDSSVGWGGGSDRAIDGQTIGRYDDGSVTHSSMDGGGLPNDRAPFLEVDLQAVRRVGQVVIHNRADPGFSGRLFRARVELSLDRCDLPTRRVARDEPLPASKIEKLLEVYKNTILWKGEVAQRTRLDFLEAPAARFICIRHDRTMFLSVAEVEVFAGVPAESLARKGVATQSSTMAGAVASRAIDGWLEGTMGFGSVTRTYARNTASMWFGVETGNSDPDPWFQLDLGAEKPVRAVAISRRTDGDEKELGQALVELTRAPCNLAQGQRLVVWSAVVPTRMFDDKPARRTELRLSDASPPVARYACVRPRATDIPLSIAELQVFGTGFDLAPAPEPPAIGVTAAVAATTELAPKPAPAETGGFAKSGTTTTLEVGLAGATRLACTLVETGSRAYTMTCGGGQPIAVTGELDSASLYQLVSVDDFGFADLAGRGLFPSELAVVMDAMAQVLGARRVKLGLDNRRGFFITGTLDLAAVGGDNPVSSGLRATVGFLEAYVPGFTAVPTFELVPSVSVTSKKVKVLLRLEVLSTCAGPDAVGPLGSGLKFQTGALEFSLAVGMSGVAVTGGFSADLMVRPTKHDPWLRFSPGIEFGASANSSSVTLKGPLSGACETTTDPCASTSLCSTPWKPVGNPWFGMSNGYLEIGLATAGGAAPIPNFKMAFDKAVFDPPGPGATYEGAFAFGVDNAPTPPAFGFQFSANKLPLTGALGVFIAAGSAAIPAELPSWLMIQNPLISYATQSFTMYNTSIPAGFRVRGGLDLAPIGLRGSIEAVVPPSLDPGTLTAGNLVVGLPKGMLKISIDTSEILRKVLSLGAFGSLVKPIVERTLWITGIEVNVGIGGFTAEVGAKVKLSMFGAEETIGFDAKLGFDPVSLAKGLASRVADLVSGKIADVIGDAIAKGFKLATEAAEVAAREVAAALAAGTTVVVNGVVTAASGVVSGASEGVELLEDAWNFVSSPF